MNGSQNLKSRCIDIKTAATYCGVHPNTLKKHGPQPIKIGHRHLYDIKILDSWIDSLSGCPKEQSEYQSEEARALAAIYEMR